MQKKLIIFFLIFVVAASIWSCGPTVLLRDKSGAGKYLTDAKGMSLYTFKKDLDGQSTCIQDCVNQWPVFYKEGVSVPEGVNTNDFSTILRIDGGKQTAYRGRPLYYFSKDEAPGDMKGEGINQNWFVVYPDKFKP